MNLRIFTIIVLLVLPPAFAETGRITSNPVPGGIVLVDLGQQTDRPPLVKFGQYPILVQAIKNRWYAIVGISATMLPGSYILTISDPEEESISKRFRVLPLDAEHAQRTRILPESMVSVPLTLDESDLAELNMGDSDRVFDNFNFDFVSPVQPRFLIPYGILVNPEESGSSVNHFALTYLVKPDSLVYAPAAGEIALIGELSDGRKVTVIQHAESLFSVLINISDVVVEQGQQVTQNELIGASQSSILNGLARLDWGIILNGALIDPMMLTSSPDLLF